MLNEWIDDPDNPITEKERPMMELYAQLTEDELVYVHELQKCYDETRCYFVQWVLSKETKELVNSARISAAQVGQPFTWKHCRAEILKIVELPDPSARAARDMIERQVQYMVRLVDDLAASPRAGRRADPGDDADQNILLR